MSESTQNSVCFVIKEMSCAAQLQNGGHSLVPRATSVRTARTDLPYTETAVRSRCNWVSAGHKTYGGCRLCLPR